MKYVDRMTLCGDPEGCRRNSEGSGRTATTYMYRALVCSSVSPLNVLCRTLQLGYNLRASTHLFYPGIISLSQQNCDKYSFMMWILYFNGLQGFCSQDVTAVSSNAASVSNVINLSLSLSGATPTVMRHPGKFYIQAELYTSLLIFPRFLLPSASLNHVVLSFLSNNFKVQSG